MSKGHWHFCGAHFNFRYGNGTMLVLWQMLLCCWRDVLSPESVCNSPPKDLVEKQEKWQLHTVFICVLYLFVTLCGHLCLVYLKQEFSNFFNAKDPLYDDSFVWDPLHKTETQLLYLFHVKNQSILCKNNAYIYMHT